MRQFLAYMALGVLGWSGSAFPASTTAPVSARRDRNLLNCNEVRTRVRFFLDLHIKYRDFSDELSRRTFQKTFETLDAERLFLTQDDIERFRGLEERIDDHIERNSCTFLDELRSVFLERVRERLDGFGTLVASTPLIGNAADASAGRKPTWARNRRELDDRWKRRFQADAAKLKPDPEPQVRERLARRYHRIANRHLKSTRDEFYSDFLNAFALSLDPHSAHFLPADQDEFNSRLGTPLDGIGITLSDETDFISVESLLKGGVAERSGRIRAGDRILAIDNLDGAGQISTSGLDLVRVARMVRGKRGSSVKLIVERPAASPREEAETFSVILVREPIRLRSLSVKSATIEWRGRQLGVVRLPAFYTDFDCRTKGVAPCLGVSSETRQRLQQLKVARLDGLLLDLRDNAGGDLQESLNVTGLFLSHGPVLQAQDRRLSVRIQEDPVSGFLYGGPLVVLVNKNSASASEIVTAALQDYGRAIIVGDSRTFGKGTIQVVQELSSPLSRVREGMIKVTQSKFFSPTGRSTQNLGVAADVVVPSLTEAYVETESEKDYSLAWEEIRPAPGFHPIQDLTPLVAQLRYLSDRRVATNKAFVELREKAARLTPEAKAALQSERAEPPEEISPPGDPQLGEALEILADSIEISRDRASWVSAMAKPVH